MSYFVTPIAPIETWVLNNVSIEVKQGEFTATLLPSPAASASFNIAQHLGYLITRQESIWTERKPPGMTESTSTAVRRPANGLHLSLFTPLRNPSRLFITPEWKNSSHPFGLVVLYSISTPIERKEVEPWRNRHYTHRSKHFPLPMPNNFPVSSNVAIVVPSGRGQPLKMILRRRANR